MTSQSPAPRLPVGQLLGNLLRLFRAELAARGESSASVDGIRPAHLQVFAVIKADGSRLTDLASWADMSLSSMAELVDGLEQLGYLERRPDPADGRAKLVCLTDSGWRAIHEGRRLIGQIETDWGSTLGADRFESLCRDMQALLDLLDPTIGERYVPGSSITPRPGAEITKAHGTCAQRGVAGLEIYSP
ncbi:MAG: MarR family winged helix-turn-helix transcriptional regulator [Solirubrobacteraceae bacterium]